MLTPIPKGDYDSPAPCWIPFRLLADGRVLSGEGEGTPIKPRIKCACGKVCNIGLHHVHEDGRVTASFYDSPAREFVENGRKYRHEPGCGWHVHLKLLDYRDGEFPPKSP